MGTRNDANEIRILPFHSRSFRLLRNGRRSTEALSADVLAFDRDVTIRENRVFTYNVVTAHRRGRARGAILLFHGLNEKYWDKYLPWARTLCDQTGKAVVLFPIAFHMNRAPADWSNPREMARFAAKRRSSLAPVVGSSFANVALSTRLQQAPERFLRSGLETYFDVLQLVDEIRAGNHPAIDGDAEIDLFGYSIGAFLAEMLMFENTRGAFSTSKAFLFCGGPTLSQMRPVSRYIMDSRANAALDAFYGEDFEANLRVDPPLRRLFDRLQTLGTTFRSMLSPFALRDFRRTRLAAVGRRLAALVLRRDQVIPQEAVRRTLSSGLDPRIAPSVESLDFAFDYTHERPFPFSAGAFADRKMNDEIGKALRLVMELAADHLR